MEALTNFRVALESFMSSSNDTPVLKVIYCVLLGLLLLGVLAILVAFMQGMRYDSLNRKRQEEQYLKMKKQAVKITKKVEDIDNAVRAYNSLTLGMSLETVAALFRGDEGEDEVMLIDPLSDTESEADESAEEDVDSELEYDDIQEEYDAHINRDRSFTVRDASEYTGEKKDIDRAKSSINLLKAIKPIRGRDYTKMAKKPIPEELFLVSENKISDEKIQAVRTVDLGDKQIKLVFENNKLISRECR